MLELGLVELPVAREDENTEPEGHDGPKDPLEALIEKGEQKRYYMHGTSHWLGLDVHDAGSYQVEGEPRPLEPGMVFTVEPGLYVSESATEVDARFRGIGVRIEDDVVVTRDGHENLNAALPKAPDELEALVCER